MMDDLVTFITQATGNHSGIVVGMLYLQCFFIPDFLMSKTLTLTDDVMDNISINPSDSMEPLHKMFSEV